MLREEFLKKVRDAAGLESVGQADRAVRAVVAVLKAALPQEQAEMIAAALPEDLKLGWEMVDAYPADILEREDMYYEGSEAQPERERPTITHG
ncbi:DUF2267 domain-containing protein [Candidatus Solincola tengchongensis]|uniref:DUF2267 domain-containing protein n=1 Tax=Candidatus Solincola tengchongensis TaxID=2900693 RepID=UPI00257A54CF|nr:DUF2267 domain-containing protein [Candidatus Solincola tengchongensis]